mgnify:CR=1 FL=1
MSQEQCFENSHLAARTFYVNILYVVIVLLAALSVGTLSPVDCNECKVLNITDDDGPRTTTFPRYQSCKLNGSESALAQEGTCIPFDAQSYAPVVESTVVTGYKFEPTVGDKEAADSLQVLFNISVAALVINSLLFVYSVGCHWGYMYGRQMFLQYRTLFSLTNIGLFSGLVGWLNSVDNIDESFNLKNNVYFEDINMSAVAISGLVLCLLDILVANYVVHFMYKESKDCRA